MTMSTIGVLGCFCRHCSWINAFGVKMGKTRAQVETGRVSGSALIGYEAYRDCDRYDILIEYKFMLACVQNCSDENSCAEKISECEQKNKHENAEKKLNFSSLK